MFEPSPSYQTQDGEPIFIGPFSKYEAPSKTCAWCKEAITVGQPHLASMVPVFFGVSSPSGRLWDFSMNDEKNFPSGPVHLACTSEYAHTYLTKEPCGQDPECRFCGVDIPYGFSSCSACAEKFGVEP